VFHFTASSQDAEKRLLQGAIQDPGVASLGLVAYRSNDALAREAEARVAATAPATQVLDRLSGHIESCWAKAKQAKIPIETAMLKSLRQRHGVYEPSKLAVIQQMGGSEVYMLLTSTKCRAAEAWIEDILRPVAERPWHIEPTPIADLPPEKEEEIKADVLGTYREVMSQAMQAQEQLPSLLLADEIKKYAAGQKDKVAKEVQLEAKERAERMSLKIADQLAQGGWHEAFAAVISDIVTLKAGVLKGPVLRHRKTKQWGKGAEGTWAPVLQKELVPEFDRVSPFDLYPAPGSRSPDDDYLIERHRLTRSDLISFLGVPGYSEEKIRLCLAEYGTAGLREELPTDSERRLFEHGTSDTSNLTGIEALQFWGSVPGSYLVEWGMSPDGLDPELEYEVDAWRIGRHVIRAVLNPDSLGKKPYSVASYEKVAGSFWGKGVPELMSDLQDLCNTVARALANNAALASGPLVEVDTGRVDDGTTAIYPWKIFGSTNQQMVDGAAVKFYQPQIIVDPLLKAFDFFMLMAEDQTNIPRWSHGNSNMGAAGGVASALSMLMTAATRGFKKVISHVDDMSASCVSRLYDYNMLYDPDESIKGDCRIVARGTSALMEKEQKTLRRTEFLAQTGNPIDVQLVGAKNRLKMLLQQARDLGLEPEEPEELEEIVAQVMQFIQQQGAPAGSQPVGAPSQPPGGAPPGPAPKMLDAAGNQAGGMDGAPMMNQPGVTPGGMM
jgi:hypothetical protein